MLRIDSTTEDRDIKRIRDNDWGSMDQRKFGINEGLKKPSPDFMHQVHEPAPLTNPSNTHIYMINPECLGSAAKFLNVGQILFQLREPNKSVAQVYDLSTVLYLLRSSYEKRYQYFVKKEGKPEYLTPETSPFFDLDSFREKMHFIGVAYGTPAPSGQEGPYELNNVTQHLGAVPITVAVSQSALFPHLFDVDEEIAGGSPLYMYFKLVHPKDARPNYTPTGFQEYSPLLEENPSKKYGVPTVIFSTEAPVRTNDLTDADKDSAALHYSTRSRSYRDYDYPTAAARAAPGWTDDPEYYTLKDGVVYKVGNTRFKYTNHPDIMTRSGGIHSRKVLECKQMEMKLDIKLIL